jgi:hypothetical protein
VDAVVHEISPLLGCSARVLPPEITIFHTGLLYAHVEQAVFSALSGTYRGVAFLACFFASLFSFAVVLMNTPGEDPYPFLLFGVAAAYFCSQVVTGFVCRRELRPLNVRMEAVARQLSPAFRVVGYTLEYKASPVRWLDPFCESYFRIAPYSPDAVAALTAEERDRAASLMKPFAAAADWTPGRSTSATAFRVAVYGRNVFAGPYGPAHEISFVSSQSFVFAKGRVDMATWGAIATEIRPLTDRYRSAKVWATNATWVFFYVMLLIFPALYCTWLLVVLVQLSCPAPVDSWWFEYVLRRSVLDQMRATVARLSPIVEERSGYTLHFETRPEGWFGGVGGYVLFKHHGGPPAGADCEKGNATIPSRGAEPKIPNGTLV